VVSAVPETAAASRIRGVRSARLHRLHGGVVTAFPAQTSLLQQFQSSSPISGGNAAFIEGLYEAWLVDPSAVGADWRAYFEALKGREAGDRPHSDAIARIEAAQRRGARATPVAPGAGEAISQKQAGVLKLVTAYRSRGHL